MIIYEIDQRSEAWHQARCGRITGTRFKFLMAGENTKTYNDLVKDIAGEILTGKMEETYHNEIMERGVEMEEEARKEYENIFDIQVNQVGFIIPDEDDPYHEWIGISPDGIVDDGLLEIKCPLMKTHLTYIEKGVLPAEYRYQVQGQLFVTGLNHCDFMSYFPDLKPFIIRVSPDQELHEEFRRRLDQFLLDVADLLEKYKNYNYL